MIYGYVRISTPKQSSERQIRNIRLAYPSAIIYKEVYTGTTIERKQLDNLLKVAKNGDVIVFDSVSRMSRNAAEGIELYQKLFDSGIELVFIKEPHINTLTYKKALSNNIPLTHTKTDIILNAVNQYLMELAKEQIELAFEQAEKEVRDLHERTKEGIQTARLAGKQIGQRAGAKLTTRKSVKSKAEIMKYSRDFGGTLSDKDVIKLLGISRNSYYRYKRELYAEREGV